MQKINFKHEWKRLNFEFVENAPKTKKPYPPEVVKRRELLLFAQTHLGEIGYAQESNELWTELVHTVAYNTIMKIYYLWGKDRKADDYRILI